MVEKYLEAFQEISNPSMATGEELKAWIGKAINIVVRVYGEDSIQEQQIRNVLFEKYPSMYDNGQKFGGGNNAKLCQKQASEVIKGFMSDLTNFGLPAPRVVEKSSEINISVNQHQNQTVKLKVIFDVINDELTEKQVKEIEEVLNGPESENKKLKIVEKLKNFGSDVATNIVASILTNPSMFS